MFPKLFRRRRPAPVTAKLHLGYDFHLENRLTPASTNFAAGVLTIDVNFLNEAVTVNNNGENVTVTSSNAITGSGVSPLTTAVTRIVVRDNTGLAGQSLTFAAGTALTLSGGLDGTGLETVTFNNAETAALTS